MVTSILTVMEQVVELFLMIGVGVVCSRVGMITRRGAAQLTSFLLYLVAPTLILVSLTGTDTDIGPEDLAMAFGLALLAHGLGILVSCLFFRKEPDARKRVFRFAAVYSNTGFMGIPLVQAVVGPEGVIYASIFVVVFNVVVWTHGYGLMSGGQRTGMKKLLLNPGLLALAVGLPMFFLDWHFPQVLQGPLESFSALNTPLAMVIIGCNIARVSLRGFFSDLRMLGACALRLLVVPGIFFAAVLALRPEPVLLLSCVIQASAPAAANTVLFASQFGTGGPLASKVVAVTTLFSIVTMPVFVVAAQWACGML